MKRTVFPSGGTGFPPSYLKITEFCRASSKAAGCECIYATATKEVREDMIDILMLEDPK